MQVNPLKTVLLALLTALFVLFLTTVFGSGESSQTFLYSVIKHKVHIKESPLATPSESIVETTSPVATTTTATAGFYETGTITGDSIYADTTYTPVDTITKDEL